MSLQRNPKRLIQGLGEYKSNVPCHSAQRQPAIKQMEADMQQIIANHKHKGEVKFAHAISTDFHDNAHECGCGHCE